MELIHSIANATTLTQLDFRDNPMFTSGFEETIQEMHSFDTLNGTSMHKPGTKYYTEID